MTICCVGTAAPPFAIDVANNDLGTSRVELSGYQGRWLALMFYPRDFSFVCPTELTDFSAKAADFADRKCELLAISSDTLETHQQWLGTPTGDGGVKGLRFPLASDADARMSRAYGVWREDDELTNRGLFLIDPRGVLRYSVIHDLSVGRNAADVLRVLDALISGGLCPANWTGTDGVLDVDAMLKPGRVLGHYRIVNELGRGAFGVVLAAEDVRLGRRVALKIFQKQSGESTTKLIEEARAAAVIDHPNVCTIHSVDEIDGMSTIVMEFIDGGPLSDVIRSGLDEANVRLISARIASGLNAAHRQGVVHGDLKPANILLRSITDPVIVDFGLARSRAARMDQAVKQSGSFEPDQMPAAKDAASDETIDMPVKIPAGQTPDLDPTISQSLSVIGTDGRGRRISGTPAYMSPEQARGESLSEASDVFSMGIIVAEMLTAQSPHQNRGPLQILSRLQHPAAVRSIADSVPESYRPSLTAMLAPNPNDRPTASEVETWFR